MTGRLHTVKGEDGLTLVEVLVAAVILVVGVLGLLSVLDTANAGTATVRAREGATTLARQVTEAARSIPYGSLTPQLLEGELQTQPGLTRRPADKDWTILRRGIRYTVSASVCVVDDPADGTGAHADLGACPESGAPGSTDRNPDDYRRVRVTVSWGTASPDLRVEQVALVNNPGSAAGPAVTGLTLSPPTTSPITSAAPTVGFTATTSSPAAAVAWSVDGVVQATATGSSTSWTFSWPVAHLVDGTYLVTARAFDRTGSSGAVRSATITLNRTVPAAPAGFVGGRNGAVVDFEWLPSPERDVVGYRVFRGAPGGDGTLVCALTRETACQDTDPPGGTPSYYVVANDLDPAGDHRDGTASEPITVTTSSQAPGPPTELTAESAGGATTLSWRAPAADGAAVAFYRIYRDGTAVAHRYDRTGSGSELSYTDSRTDGTEHRYTVTAVSSQLAESAHLGPVTR